MEVTATWRAWLDDGAHCKWSSNWPQTDAYVILITVMSLVDNLKDCEKNARFFSENRLGNCVSFFKQDPKTPKMGTEYPAYNV